jgi:hypothetical protein
MKTSDLNLLSFLLAILAVLGYKFVAPVLGYILFGAAIALNLAVDRRRKKEQNDKKG